MKKKIKHYILLFLLPVFIFFLIATMSNIVPFGKYIFNCFDSFHMYIALLTKTIKNFSYYTLNGGLGTNLYSIKCLYMNSPLNYLFLLFKNNQVYDFYTILIYLRVGLSALTMGIYINSISKEKYSFKNIIFASLYALSSYGVACCIQIMWMDAFILLPLLILGLDNIIDKNKNKLYMIILTSIIIINYYLGYMLCIFSLIYFIYKTVMEKKLNKKVIKTFIISSILCAITSCFVIIPSFYSLLAGRAHTFDIKSLFDFETFTMYSSVINFNPGAYIVIDNYNEGTALVYCGLLTIILNILFYFNDHFSKREKIATLILSLFFILGSFINLIDYAWNMFQKPVWWNHRYMFVFVFMLIITGFKCYEHKEEINITYKKKLIIFIIYSLLAVGSFSLKFLGFKLSNLYCISLFVGIILFYFYITYINKKKLTFVLFILLFGEVMLNGYLIFDSNVYNTRELGVDTINTKTNVINNINDDDFYRIVADDWEFDDPLLYNYNGISLFSSIYNNDVQYFLSKKVGVFEKAINRIGMYYYNPAITALLSTKYYIGDQALDTLNEVYYYENYINFGLSINNDIKSINLEDNDVINNINKIYSSLYGEEVNLFTKVKYDDETRITNLKINYTSSNDDMVFDFTAPNDGIIVPKRSGLYSRTTYTINGIMAMEDKYNLIKVKKGDKVHLVIALDDFLEKQYDEIAQDDCDVYILNYDLLTNIIKKISTYDHMEEIDTTNHVLEGKINITKDNQTLFLSIPYDEFILKVDGEKYDYEQIMDAFVGIDLDKGEHTITIDYIPKGLNYGIVISIIGLLGSILYLIIKNKE